jgi:tetratricopeptide (TPR) repeat protein
VFTSHPVVGVGAGGYTVAYYKQRRTTEAIENPHSIELELLAELGLVGGGLLVALIAAVVLGARRWRAAARESPSGRTLLVCTAGISVTWLVDTSADWMHLLPGVTAIALMAVAVLCYQEPLELCTAGTVAQAASVTRRRSGVLRAAGAAATGFLLALTGASLMRSGLAQIYLDAAQSELSANPAAALRNANRALRLDGANLSSFYIKAAALARFDQAAASRAVLLQASAEQPSNYVTWVLLGDLEVRAGKPTLARSYYRTARSLDPNDPTLAALVADPASALAPTS